MFLSLKLFKSGEIDGVKFLAWKSKNFGQTSCLIYWCMKISNRPNWKSSKVGCMELFMDLLKAKRERTDEVAQRKCPSVKESSFWDELFESSFKQAWPTQKFISNFQVPIFRLYILVSRSCPHVDQTPTLNSLWTELKPCSSRLHFRLLQTLSNHCHPSSTA